MRNTSREFPPATATPGASSYLDITGTIAAGSANPWGAANNIMLHQRDRPDSDNDFSMVFKLDESSFTTEDLAKLVTDVNLKLGSGFCGLALAAVMRRRWPQLGVLYVTGHPECLTGRRLGARERCLAKPFSSAKLTRAVRDLMPNYHQRRGAA